VSSVSSQPPLFHPGDWVSFAFGPKNRMLARILEDRGPLGVRGRRLYRVQPPQDALGESSPFEMPEDELEPAAPPVRQEYTVQYFRQKGADTWRAKTWIGEIHWGVKAKGAISYTTALWEGQSTDDLNSATVTVLLEVDPSSNDPTVDVPSDVRNEMIAQARVMADEMFRSRHPRARVVHD
jgi:hypothetical protein